MALTKKAQENLKKLFGGEPGPHPQDPELYEILQNQIFDEVFSTGVIDEKKREMVTVVVLSSLQTLPQLKAHTNAALNIGNQPIEIREAIYQIAPYIGYPRTLNAINTIDEVFKERGIELPLPAAGTVKYEEREEKGAEIQIPRYGNEVKEVFASLPGVFGQFVPHMLTAGGFGDYATRGVLSDADKELYALIALVAIGAATQIRPHIAGAVKAGNTLEEVTAAVVQAMPYTGFPYALSALMQIAKYDGGASSEAYR